MSDDYKKKFQGALERQLTPTVRRQMIQMMRANNRTRVESYCGESLKKGKLVVVGYTYLDDLLAQED